MNVPFSLSPSPFSPFSRSLLQAGLLEPVEQVSGVVVVGERRKVGQVAR